MEADASSYQKGNCVRVRNGVMAPDFEGLSIAGWQGTIRHTTGFEGDGLLLTIKLDGDTLRQMPKEYILGSEFGGLSFQEILLDPEQVEPAEARNPEEDVNAIAEEIRSRYDDDIEAYIERKRGRNARCPCGSGRRYKACCL